MSDLLTCSDVAEHLRVSVGFVKNELAMKRMRGMKLPGAAGWRVTPDDLETYKAAKANVSRVRGAA